MKPEEWRENEARRWRGEAERKRKPSFDVIFRNPSRGGDALSSPQESSLAAVREGGRGRRGGCALSRKCCGSAGEK